MAQNVPPWTEEPQAYRKLGLLYAACPDIAVSKIFRAAHAEDLLLLEAEIINVQVDYNQALSLYKQEHQTDGIPIDSSVRKLKNFCEGPKSPWNLAIKRRKLLKLHADTLLTIQKINKLPQVNTHHLSALQEWYHDVEGGNMFMHGTEKNIWKNVADLTSLNRDDGAVDGVLLKIRDYIVSILFWTFKDKTQKHVLPLHEPTSALLPIDTPIAWYPESKLRKILSILSTVVASSLPALSIFTLVYIQNLLLRVGIILILTLLFSITMVLLGKARRVEVWAVSAAFSAVLVVFVGGSNVNICNNGTTQ